MIEAIHKCAPAYEIIELLGGKTSVSELLDLDKSTLSRWCQKPPRGTGGLIPQRYWTDLLKAAKRQGVALTVEDLAAVKA